MDLCSPLVIVQYHSVEIHISRCNTTSIQARQRDFASQKGRRIITIHIRPARVLMKVDVHHTLASRGRSVFVTPWATAEWSPRCQEIKSIDRAVCVPRRRRRRWSIRPFANSKQEILVQCCRAWHRSARDDLWTTSVSAVQRSEGSLIGHIRQIDNPPRLDWVVGGRIMCNKHWP